MSQPTEKDLVRAITGLMALIKAERSDPSAAPAIESAIEVLSARSGRAVANAFIAWHRSGCITRDPRPAEVRPVGPMPSDVRLTFR